MLDILTRNSDQIVTIAAGVVLAMVVLSSVNGFFHWLNAALWRRTERKINKAWEKVEKRHDR